LLNSKMETMARHTASLAKEYRVLGSLRKRKSAAMVCSAPAECLARRHSVSMHSGVPTAMRALGPADAKLYMTPAALLSLR